MLGFLPQGEAPAPPGSSSRVAELRRDDGGASDVSPFNPKDAVMAMGRFDCALATAVRSIATTANTPVLSLVLAAYNAGPHAVV